MQLVIVYIDVRIMFLYWENYYNYIIAGDSDVCRLFRPRTRPPHSATRTPPAVEEHSCCVLSN